MGVKGNALAFTVFLPCLFDFGRKFRRNAQVIFLNRNDGIGLLPSSVNEYELSSINAVKS